MTTGTGGYDGKRMRDEDDMWHADTVREAIDAARHSRSNVEIGPLVKVAERKVGVNG